ncbi:MAG: hypothetical protein A3B37_02620 [Candidatus Sungbacteria bacterium RIFCSPLOWO2_01_FULL_59_16]|uniref:Ribonuclease n=1 Tax=Candidatus Sungbacteria bacterium RIFCSPLOWO2_01_FULL_59_16 TaxID=1802280 RepID=A0A1G2LD12_9BACT|nr:MAG: hypothetical protein A3B37_02620 [Candidatus Sungbacteria bacterium RIFCSPLOWO2_01_FULL_59_16]
MKRLIIGIDEVGRGALAGPVVLAAVARTGRVRLTHSALGRIRECKQLTAKRREAWFSYLTGHPRISWRIARVSPSVIDRINITRAANLAARRLVRRMATDRMPCLAWLDGGLALPERIPHRVFVKGDERKSIIAAASIIAKVSRDRLMARLHRVYPAYCFHLHKGYGSSYHRRMIRMHGPSPVHRRSFLSKLI